ncbi:MAG: mechanosensitive ion channel family protein [Eubacteriaceae bacterium]|jgi:small-conductance mechanosensitive channel
MVFDSFGEMLRSFMSKFDLSVITEKLISVLLTILLFFILYRISVHILRRFFSDKNPLSSGDSMRRLTLYNSLKSFLRWGFLIIGLLTILSYFIDIGAILAVAGVGTIAIGFAAQGIVEDVMSGFIIIVEDQFNVGDYVTIDGHYGTVERISVRTTSIRQLDGGLFMIYNGQIKQCINYSKGDIVAGIDIGIGYNENIDKVLEILKTACHDLFVTQPELFSSEPQVIGVTGMDANSVTVRVISEESAANKAQIQSVLWTYLKDRMAEKNIRTPFSKVEVLDPDTMARFFGETKSVAENE